MIQMVTTPVGLALLMDWKEWNSARYWGSRCTQQGSGLGNSELHRRRRHEFTPACRVIVSGRRLCWTAEWLQTRSVLPFLSAQTWEVRPRCSDAPWLALGWLSPSLPHLDNGHWAQLQQPHDENAYCRTRVGHEVLEAKGETMIFITAMKPSRRGSGRGRHVKSAVTYLSES